MAKQLWQGFEEAASNILTTELNSLADGGNKLSAAFDNSADLFVFEDVEVLVKSVTTPAADAHAKLYILPSVDGTNYADGTDSIDPADSNEVYTVLVRAAAADQYHTFRGIILPPGLYKYLFMSEIGVTMAATLNTLKRRPYNLKTV